MIFSGGTVILLMLSGCRTLPESVQTLTVSPQLPLVTWETSVEVLPLKTDPLFCEVHWSLSRRQVFSDTAVVENIASPSVVTAWGEPAEVRILAAEPFEASSDSTVIRYADLPGYDPTAVNGFIFRAYPRIMKEGHVSVRSEFYLKAQGQTAFKSVQNVILKKEE